MRTFGEAYERAHPPGPTDRVSTAAVAVHLRDRLRPPQRSIRGPRAPNARRGCHGRRIRRRLPRRRTPPHPGASGSSRGTARAEVSPPPRSPRSPPRVGRSPLPASPTRADRPERSRSSPASPRAPRSHSTRTLSRSDAAEIPRRASVDEYTLTYHARLSRSGDQWLLTDFDSTNGTKLGGERVTKPVTVPLYTPVTIGTTTFELRP